MKLKCEQRRIKIIPENEIEEAYLQEVFNLRTEGNRAIARRIDVVGLNCIAFLEIVPDEEAKLQEVRNDRDG